jgi:hypothetical protein
VPDFLVPIAKRIKLVRLVSGIYAKFLKRVKRKLDPRMQLENRFGHYRPGPGSEKEWQEAFDRSLRLVDAFQLYCKAHQIKVVIFNYPYAPAVTTSYADSWKGLKYNWKRGVILDPTFHKAVREFAKGKDIPYYDFTPYVRSLPDLQGIFNDEDGHYAERGYKLLARELVRFLVPLVDEATAARARKRATAE